MSKFVLIGSGLAGGLLAAYLGRRGYDVDLYERRADPREGNIVGGRSINLALSTRGIHGLEQLGIADEPCVVMLNEAQQQLFQAPQLAVYPGVAIALTVLGLNLLGDGLRDRLDPRLVRRGSLP